MQRLEVSGAVRPIYGSLGLKRLMRLSVTPANENRRTKSDSLCSSVSAKSFMKDLERI